MAALIFLRTFSLVLWSLYEMFIAFDSISFQRPVFFSLTLLSSPRFTGIQEYREDGGAHHFTFDEIDILLSL